MNYILKTTKKTYDKNTENRNLNGFKIYLKKIYTEEIINEFCFYLDKQYVVNKEIYIFYDSIYYKKFNEHLLIPKDSIFFHSKGYHTNENRNENECINNWFNKIYYCLHKNTTKKDSLYITIMNEKFYHTPFNVVSLLSHKNEIDLNKVNYKFLIIFETLLPVYDFKNDRISFRKKVL